MTDVEVFVNGDAGREEENKHLEYLPNLSISIIICFYKSLDLPIGIVSRH